MCADCQSLSAPRLLRGLGNCQSGIAAIEFALLFPVLLLFLLGTYAVGLAMHNISSVNYALEQTARILALKTDKTESQLQESFAQNLASLGKQAATLTKSVTKDASGSDVALLTATYSYSINIPFVAAYTATYSKTANVFLAVPH